MDRVRGRMALVGFLVGCMLASTVSAAEDDKDDDDNEFAFNLFTDIAPILALFGEQFAKQFMSESFTWLDHVIFAMVPLGIVAGITSAIRVQGPYIVRAFIGRARENKALVEYELMSSTSHEVGEAFNGQGVVRVMGRPRVVEFVIFPKQYDDAEEFFGLRDQEGPTGNETEGSEISPTVHIDGDEWSDSSYGYSSVSSDSSEPEDDDVRADDVRVDDEGNSVNTSMSSGLSSHVDEHDDCGIHTLESITKANNPGLMRYGAYHSHGYKLLSVCQEILKDMLTQLVSLSEDIREGNVIQVPRGRNMQRDPEIAETLNVQEKQAKEKVESADESSSATSLSEPTAQPFLLGPPNLQLNLTPDHADEHRYNRRIFELYVVAVVAVLLQAGLVVLTAATVYYRPLRDRILYDSQSYGFPCYAAGTALLCLGMGICSYAVERNSVEVEWTAAQTEDAASLPRLLFLQQEHSVNDQFFDAYTLLSGRRSRILGSARNPNSYSTKLVNTSWEWITVAGAVAAGVGFTCQFMGLRGLTYPCSLAQLGAVVLMVILRGFIRRGLGRESAHSPLLPGYELEHLAILITYLPEFRSFDNPKRSDEHGAESQSLNDIFGWQVILPQSRAQGLKTKTSMRDVEVSDVTSLHNVTFSVNPRLYIPSPSSFQPASSEQLLRVRRRLGNLCQWKSKSTEHAIILTRSIEHFMDTFFPPESGDGLPSVKSWKMPVAGPMGEDQIKFVMTREERKWRIDIGQVEAAMSLWMAFMGAKMQPSTARARPHMSITGSAKGESDWLRDEDGTGRQRFYRILGESIVWDPTKRVAAEDEESENDGTDSEYSGSESFRSISTDSDLLNQPAPRLSALERDIKWWIGDQFSLISRPTRDYGKLGKDPAKFDPWLVQGPHILELPELVIGFNAGFEKEEDEPDTLLENKSDDDDAPHGRSHELGVIAEGYLGDILAQHLFTSFIWAVSKELGEDCLKVGYQTENQDIDIENRDQFDINQFDGTWYLPKLSHAKLRETVRQIEGYGLGTKVDILLCIIPALSKRDLLPNHAMLRLIPPVSPVNDWASIARCYNSLMMSTLDIVKPEKLCYAATVHVMDFLELACQPYSKSLQPSEYLLLEIREMVRNLRVSHFLRVLQGIVAALHNRQGRGTTFESIIRLYGGDSSEWQKLLSLYQKGDTNMDDEGLKKVVGFSWAHQQVSNLLHEKRSIGFNATYKEITEQDIFGWTPLHYCSSWPDWQSAQMLLWKYCTKSPRVKCHHYPDRLGRTPLHIAASKGFEEGLLWMTCELAPSEQRNALLLQGQDGMTLLHLASLSSNQACLDFILNEKNVLQAPIKDAWGREPLHIASQSGNIESLKKILSSTAWSLSPDLLGKTPVHYALLSDGHQTSNQTIEHPNQTTEHPNQDAERADQDTEDHASSISENHTQTASVHKSQLEILIEIARIRPKWRGEAGESFIHLIAAKGDKDIMNEFIKNVSIVSAAETTNMPDTNGRTPLYYAIIAGKTATAVSLIQDFNVDPFVEDIDKTTPLMLAVQHSLTEFVKVILKNCTLEDINKQNRAGDSVIKFVDNAEGKSGRKSRLEMLKILKEAGCNLLQQGDTGQTILHLAIRQKDRLLVTYLLGLPRDELETINQSDDPLLIEACRYGSAHAVSHFLELWPDTLRAVDELWGRSPLSWACKEGRADIIRILLKNAGSDLSYSADSHGETPLHLAAEREDPKALACLLEHDNLIYDLFITDNSSRTPLDLAIARRRVQTSDLLLHHPRTSDLDRKKYLRELLEADTEVSRKFHQTIQWLSRSIPETLLESEDLLRFISKAQDLRLFETLDVLIRRSMNSEVWKLVHFPYHAAIETGNSKLIADAIEEGIALRDRDGWSLQDYAASRDRSNLLQPLDPSSLPSVSNFKIWPETIVWGEARLYRKVSHCRLHGEVACLGIQAVHCKRSSYWPTSCVPVFHSVPYSSHGGCFYFEVTIRVDSPSRLLALGFCSESKQVRGMPGSLNDSWGFYGNTGHLLVRGPLTGEDESMDLGYVQTFGAGDIVGVGWNSITGEALCTRNGERLQLADEMRRTIKSMMLNTGKKYACIGHDMGDRGVGLQFRVNLGLALDHHPFMYEGPFF